jgi:hypothetical protein
MYNTIFAAFVLTVAVSPTLPLQCQSCVEKAAVPRTKPARWKSIPYTLERRNTTVITRADGSTTTSDDAVVTATDSEGRSLFADTPGATGHSSFIVDDPVTGTRTAWNSENREAKVLTFPAAVAGRRSCWRVPVVEQRLLRSEPQLGYGGVTCPPAERNQGTHCGERGNAVEPSPGDSPEAKPSYEDCSRMLDSAIVSGKISEKNEDLGVETILGVETHGCRSTVVTSDGAHMREMWYTKFGSVRRNVSLPLRSVDESPAHLLGQMGTTRTTWEATSLRLGEPDAEMFHSPDDYAIKKVNMQEVPCEASNPRPAAATSH